MTAARVMVLLLGALAVAGCQSAAKSPAALAPVEAASPAAAQGPIDSFNPAGIADPLAQIRVIFRDDLIPLQSLETPDETAILAKFSIAPALPGHFRFLTPRMIGFQADAAIPLATRVRVTIAKGLRDLHGRTLDRDFTWTFQTASVTIGNLPLQDDAKGVPDGGPLTPQIRMTSNVALDVPSLIAHAALVPAAGGSNVALVAPKNSSTPNPAASPGDDDNYDPSEKTYSYVLVPDATLKTATNYAVVVSPGVRSATGNLPSSDTFQGRIATYGALTFTGVTQSQDNGDRINSGMPALHFNTPVDDKSLAAITLSPAPAAGTLLASSGTDVNVNPALLAPNTDYTFTVGRAVTDIYGQTLGSDARATFRTTDLSPHVWAPAGMHIFPAPFKVGLNVTTVNVRPGTMDALFVTLQPADVVHFDDVIPDNYALFSGPRAHLETLATKAPPNTETTISIPMRAKLGGPTGALAYTMSAPRLHDGTAASPFDGLVQITNLGTFAQWFPDSGFVRVDHLSDGTPAIGAVVSIYRSQVADTTKTEAAACAAATTGSDGIARFSGTMYQTCAALDLGKNAAPSLVTIVREGRDWTWVRTDDSAGAYSGDLYTGWSSAEPIARSTFFSDRDLYQPGETAQLTAVGWFLEHGTLGRGKSPGYDVVLMYPNQEKHTLPRMTLNAYGTASVPIVLPKNAPLGYYQINAKAANGETIDGSFRVAEFKPPNFKVALTLPATVAVAGSSVAASTTSTYLFGSPVQGASTSYDVTRDVTNFSWDKDPDYAFGRRWFWPENSPTVSSDVVQTTSPVDANGISTATIPVAADLPYPMSYRVDADTTDVANLTVGDTKTFTAFPGPVQIGLKTAFVATAGQPAKITAIALDPSGAPVPNSKIHIELQRATFLEATAVVEGSDSASESVTYKTVADTNVTSGDNAVVAELTPPDAGTYRVRANGAGASSDATETDTQLYVTGSGDAGWGSPDPSRLDIHLDKPKYKLGDTAHAIIASPFPDADILVAVVRNHVMWQQRMHTHGSSPTVSFTVTPAMLPNAALEAIAVRRGAPPLDADMSAGNALARNGFASFDVALDSKYLKVAATPAHASLAPAARQSVKLHVTDRNGKPVVGQVTVIVANDAVLQLSGYRPPDLAALVYGDQPISTRFADNRGAVILKTLKESVNKGWGFGGGLSTGAEDTRIRRNFQPLAYYAGSILTDANGNATTTFDLPDDLTSWRIMAVATTTDGRFGNGEATFMTTKPLIANPVVPQFARPGDTFSAGIAITNTSDANGTLAINGALTGPLSFVSDGKRTATTLFSAPVDRITKAYRFPVLATAVGTSEATFRVTRTGGTVAHDGFAIPVNVVDRAVLERVITTGVNDDTNGTVAVPLNVAANTPNDAGGLDMVLANSVLPDALVAARAVFENDDMIALSAASRLTVAADIIRLSSITNLNGPVAAARAQAASAITFLASAQRPDGGFASYPGSTSSDPMDSLDVLHAYARAGDAGIAIDASSRSRAQAFAAKVLDDPGTWEWCKNDPCKSMLRLHALDALADSGDRRTTFLGDIDAVRNALSLTDQIRLARYQVQSPGYTERGADEAQAFYSRTYLTGSLGTFNLPDRYGWSIEPVIAQSYLTRLAVAQHADAQTVDRLTRSLLALRTFGSWGCACQNAAALDALTDVAAAAGPPPDYTLTAHLGTKQLAAATFTGHRAAAQQVHTPAAQLPRGASTLAIAKTGTGPLHYAVTYAYRLSGAQRGQLAGVRITRIVHAAGSTDAQATMGIAALAGPVTVTAAHVFDIELQVITDHPIDRVSITDPLPAGFEAVDTSFATSTARAPSASWQIDSQQIYHDRIEAYADHLGPGVYVLHYIARSVTPGTFSWPGADAHLGANPDEFGRTASATLTIQ